MTQSNTEAPRANRDGDPCPGWCITEHDAPIVRLEDHSLYPAVHGSAAIRYRFSPAVRVTKVPGQPAMVAVHSILGQLVGRDALSAAQAEQLGSLLDGADLLQCPNLGESLVVAARIARETA